jgi:hypothetical protein
MVLAAGGFYACAAKTPPGRGRAVVLTIVLRNVPGWTPRSVAFKYGHSRIVAAEAADGAASYCSRAAHQDAGITGCHAPSLSRGRY